MTRDCVGFGMCASCYHSMQVRVNGNEFHLCDMLLGAFLMLALIMLGSDPVTAFTSLLLGAIVGTLIAGRLRRRAS